VTYHTPASLLRAKGKPALFATLAIGDTFEFNGNVWTKRSSRTAVGIWPASLPEWIYFSGKDVVRYDT